jgi:ankyrin repeat protein
VVQRLLDAGASASSANEDGATALMTCARTGNTASIKALLGRGADVNAVEKYKGQTALMWASAENNVDAVRMLIEAGATVTTKSKAGFTPLLFAVRSGNIDTLKVLIAGGANVKDAAADGTSALGMAVINAQYATALALLDAGADPNASDPRGSILHSLAWMRVPGANPAAGAGGAPIGPPPSLDNVDTLDVARAMLKHGADPNRRINWREQRYDRNAGQQKLPPDIPIGRRYITFIGATPFYVAAQNGDVDYMKVLAEGGADPKLPSSQNITPLMAAAGIGYWDGESPGPHAGPVPETQRIAAVKLAIDLGNDINAHADFGDYTMDGEGEELLLNYPKNLDKVTDKVHGDIRWTGSTALHGAVVSGQLGIVQFLVEHGAQIDAKNKLGWTPLMLADGIFVSNTKKEFPEIGVYLRRQLKAKGLPVPAPLSNASEVVRAKATNFEKD